MYEYNAIVVRVVDGDTVDLIVDLGFRMTTIQRFRLLGIDTPERGKPGFTEATNRMKELLAPGYGKIVTTKADSFGRWLVTIWVKGMEESVNQKMLDDGFAVLYV